jgi:obg-like ATPase 1
MSKEDRDKFIEENKTRSQARPPAGSVVRAHFDCVPRSQIGKIVVEGYHTLQLVHFYTSGPDECRCWTIRDGWLAPKAAGTIHTDFERGFIKAEVKPPHMTSLANVSHSPDPTSLDPKVYNWKDWKENDCSETKVKEAGKYRQEGKAYQVKDKDIIFFKFNVTNDARKK